MNPREFEILNLLSSKEARSGPAPKPVQLAQALAADPDAPTLTDLMAVAAGTASEPVAAKVNTYCRANPELAEMLRLFERFARGEEIPAPPIEGSILERMKVRTLDRSKPDPGVEPDDEGPAQNAEGWSHAMAASTGTSGAEREGAAAPPATASAADWWVLRPTSDGGTVYVGSPARVRDGDGWGTVIVTLPTGHVRGVVAYTSPDLVVVTLDGSGETLPEGK